MMSGGGAGISSTGYGQTSQAQGGLGPNPYTSTPASSAAGFGVDTYTPVQAPGSSGPGLNSGFLGGAAMGFDNTLGDTFVPVQTQSSVPFGQRLGNMFGGMNTGVQNTLTGMNDALRGNAQPTQQPVAPPANTGNQIGDLYQNLLGRQGDEAGMSFWNQQLQSGTSIDDIRNAFMGTDEYKNRQARNTVGDMYQNLLGRQGDEAGMNFWANQLRSGTSQDDIRNAFMGTDEYRSRQAQQSLNAQNIDSFYQNLLGRAPDQAGRDFWIQKANEGVPLADIRQAIAGSPEYQAVPNRPMGATAPVQSAPRYVAPIVSESGGAGSGGAMNYQYRRGGIAALLRK